MRVHACVEKRLLLAGMFLRGLMLAFCNAPPVRPWAHRGRPSNTVPLLGGDADPLSILATGPTATGWTCHASSSQPGFLGFQDQRWPSLSLRSRWSGCVAGVSDLPPRRAAIAGRCQGGQKSPATHRPQELNSPGSAAIRSAKPMAVVSAHDSPAARRGPASCSVCASRSRTSRS